MSANKNDFSDFLDELNHGKNDTARDVKKRGRGLPDDKSRLQLAQTYLKIQTRLWPELVKRGVLSKRGNAQVMADEFRQAFEAGRWNPFEPPQGMPCWQGLGTAYLRYSDENSNPRSLDQQLLNVLEKAKKEGIFIPWRYVFADAAVTGTIAARRGYQLAKRLIQSTDDQVDVLMIDEIGRASRDAVEALQLGRIIDSSRKRMIGAVDGFDSALPGSRMQLHIYAMVHEYFVDQLREKVRRGMRDGFAQGKNIYPTAAGYKLVEVRDPDGNLVLGDDDAVVKERVIDDRWAPSIVDAFRWYADHSWSMDRIARAFNERGVGGYQTWDSSRVGKLIERPVYHGVEFYEMTYQIKDRATGGVTVKQRPEGEWKRRGVPAMRIVPEDLWERAQARRVASKAAYAKRLHADKPSRTGLHPKSLVRPVCSGCQKPMILGRAGRYASYFCENGKSGKRNCQFRGYKSARIIDTAIVECVAQTLFTEEFLATVVAEANRYLQQEPAGETKIDTAAVEAAIRRKTRSIETITQKLDDADDTQDLQAVFARVKKLQQEVDSAWEQLSAAKALAVPKPNPMTIEEVMPLLEDLRNLLRDDIGAAAPALAALTGPVVVSLEEREEGGGREWKARFQLNSVPVFLFLAVQRNCPTAGTWEYLNTRRWTIGKTVKVWLYDTPKHELIASQVKTLTEQGMSIDSIARQLKTNWMTVKAAVDFAQAGGVSPDERVTKKPVSKNGRQLPKEVDLEVVRLRDQEGWSFVKIAKELGIGNTTASRAYDRGRGTTNGEPHKRGHFQHLSKEVFELIATMLRKGCSVAEIAVAAGCSENTVRRYDQSTN